MSNCINKNQPPFWYKIYTNGMAHKQYQTLYHFLSHCIDNRDNFFFNRLPRKTRLRKRGRRC